MKTAEELFNENTGSFPNNRTAIVTLIQLKSLERDSFKAGMLKAVRIADRMERDDGENYGISEAIESAIHKSAEERKGDNG